ncbi:aldo/keto reductase [Brachybacterium saurashtrense]|uniref:Aldo/keto reductase n=1 Tax=Brachybacterium saurashtrense TaxID=556288 RepID=A0A345YR94_9MICO|nr:aldo/keto reductase [Brachybacterium saurashtrense]AXK46446.1 aldo/keto reductase [Brachybacterium saurashtrense]RRR24187.1 aldo/keto reductase [Brachybacterium saurashtrense]
MPAQHPVVPALPFADGRTIPQLGYGVFKVEPDIAADVTSQALAAGYRHLDTARIYRNEEGVGRAIAESGIPREELFVTTKLWDDAHAFDDAIAACEASLERLGLEYVDLYLIHWAAPSQGQYVEAWKALIALQERGLVRSIGVSNFPAAQLTEIIEATGVTPVIHQIELHPYFPQRELRALHAEHGILTESWGPLGQGKSDLLENGTVTEIAAAHEASPAQVVLAWHLAHGIVTIPKSVTPSRIVENLAAVELTLTAEEVAALDALGREDGRGGTDPATK